MAVASDDIDKMSCSLVIKDIGHLSFSNEVQTNLIDTENFLLIIYYFIGVRNCLANCCHADEMLADKMPPGAKAFSKLARFWTTLSNSHGMYPCYKVFFDS